MKTFIGMNYLMSSHKILTMKGYWSTNEDMGIPYNHEDIELYKRFMEIHAALNFNNNVNSLQKHSSESRSSIQIQAENN